MKTKNVLLMYVIVTIALVSGCMKKNPLKDSSQLTDEQKVSLQTMNTAYNNAKSANDSLNICSNMNHTDSMMINQFDSCFHANDSIFNICHSNMISSSSGSMMSGTTGGMMGSGSGSMMGSGNGGMMGNGNSICNSQNTGITNVIEKMKNLKFDHVKLHHKK